MKLNDLPQSLEIFKTRLDLLWEYNQLLGAYDSVETNEINGYTFYTLNDGGGNLVWVAISSDVSKALVSIYDHESSLNFYDDNYKQQQVWLGLPKGFETLTSSNQHLFDFDEDGKNWSTCVLWNIDNMWSWNDSAYNDTGDTGLEWAFNLITDTRFTQKVWGQELKDFEAPADILATFKKQIVPKLA